MAASTVKEVMESLQKSLSPQGFEVHPLKVGWYNNILSPALALPYPDDTLAVVVFSTPSMFENSFLDFLKGHGFHRGSDPIDQCVKKCVSSAVSQCFPDQKVDVSYDYERLHSLKPRFLAQTAAHVSGGAFYYQQKDVSKPPWDKKKMFGVCIHPKYGGWFAIRALLVFVDMQGGSDMQQPSPLDCVPSREDRIQLLEDFNLRWEDYKYRDVIKAEQSYSKEQRDYFSCPPAERLALLKSWGFLQDTEESETTAETEGNLNGHG